MSKPITDPVWLTVSGEVHKHLEAVAFAPLDISQTTFHADGRVTFPLRKETVTLLKNLNPDPELAMRKLLGMKSN
jgi:hypothetical protein